MGISTEQWRARIGTYNGGRGRRMCGAHQSSFSHHAVFWTTGEIMSTTPLTVQAGVAFVSLWMVLCAISCWWKKIESSHSTKLNRGSCYHWSKDIRATVSVTVCVSLVTAAAVLLHCLTLLLIMAGDVELNPGPGMDTELTVADLSTVLEKLLNAQTQWFYIGLKLRIVHETLKSIQVENKASHECLRAVLTRRLQIGPPLTWRELCECLRSPLVDRNDVAEEIRVWIESQSQDTSEQAGIASRKRLTQEPIDESLLPKNIKLEDFPKVGDLQKESGESSPGVKKLTLKELQRSKGLSDSQLDQELHSTNMPSLAMHFNNPEYYAAKFGLCAAECKDVENEKSTQSAMCKALQQWQQSQPYKATYKNLIEIALDLGKVMTALKVCDFVSEISQQDLQKENGKSSEKDSADSSKVIDLSNEVWSKIEKDFGKMLSELKKSLETRNVKPEELVVCLLGCSHRKQIFEGSETMFMHIRAECAECESITKFLLKLSDYFTFYSYSILKVIVDSEYATSDDKKRFKEYDEHFEEYSQELVRKYNSDYDLSNTNGVTQVTVKIEKKFRNINDEHLKEFKEKLEIALKVLSEHLHLIDLQPGSTVLIYHAPLIVEVAAFPLSPEQEDALTHLGVIWLKCGNYKFPSEIPDDPLLDSADADSDNVLESNTGGNLAAVQTSDVASETSHAGSVDDSFSSTYQTEAASSINELASEGRQQQRKHPDGPDSDSGHGTSLPITKNTSSKSSKREYIDRTEKSTGEMLLNIKPFGVAHHKPMNRLTINPIDLSDISSQYEFSTPDENTILHLASVQGNVTQVMYCVEVLKCDPNSVNQRGRSALHSAAQAGHENVVRYLAQLCNVIEDGVYSPLHLAALNGHCELVKFFASEQKVDPLLCVSNSNPLLTPLQCACINGNQDIVIFLVKKRQENQPISSFVHETTILGDTLLHYAALSGSEELTKYLIENCSIKPLVTNKNGATPFHLAVFTGNKIIVSYYMEHLNFEENLLPVESTGQNALHIAAAHCHVDIVKHLLFHYSRIDPTARDWLGCSALHYAALSGNLEIFQFLMSQTADIDLNEIIDNEGHSIFHFAVRSGNLALLKFLFTCVKRNQTAVINYKDKRGWTPLHHAIDIFGFKLPKLFSNCKHDVTATDDQLEVIHFLVNEMKCNPMTKTIDGQNLLHISFDFKIVEFLTKKLNINPTICDDAGQTALHYACEYGELSIVQFLIKECKANKSQKSTSGAMPIHFAAKSCNINLLVFLIEQGCDPNTEDNKSNTLVHFSCIPGRFNQVDQVTRLNTIKFLVRDSSFSCDPGCVNTSKQIPLHLACQYGYTDVVKFLVDECGCDLLAEDNDEQTPLHVACRYGWAESMKFLLTKYKNDEKKLSSLHIACKYGHHNIVKYLVEDCKFDILAKDSNGRVPLWYACDGQYKEIMIYLTKLMLASDKVKGKNIVNQIERLPGSTSILNLACKQGNLEIVKLLFCSQSGSDKFAQTPLHYAAAGGQTEVVEYLLQQGCDPMSKDIFGNTALHYCIAGEFYLFSIINSFIDKYSEEGLENVERKKEVIRALVKKDKRVLDTKNDEGGTVLHVACKKGYIDFVKFFIEECKCDMTTCDYSNRTILHQAVHPIRYENRLTALHIASQCSSLTVVKYLIEKGCDPMQRDIDGDTPAHYAAQNGHLSVVKYLKEQLNCDLNTTNNKGRMPIHSVCMRGKIDVVQYLVEECRVEFNSRDKQECTPFLLANVNGHLTVVEYLIEKGCDPMQRDIHGNTPAHYAAQNGHLSVVKYLKEQLNCDLNTTNNEGRMPIHFACSGGKIDVVQYLVEECRVEFNSRDKQERTPFLLANANGHLTVVEYLIEKRCDPMQRDIHGNTPAHYAALDGHLSVVKYLKEQLNCDLNTTNNEGRMPVHLACIEGKIDVVQYLVEECRVEFNSRDKQERSPFLLANANGHLTVVEYLIEKGCDPMQRDIYGNTPAHYAAQNGHLSVVKYLKEQLTCDLNTTNNEGRMPIHLACIEGKIDVVQYLVEECRVEFNSRDKEERTPFLLASAIGHLTVVKYLIEKRCDPSQRDIHGNIPAHYAAQNGHLSVVKYLKEQLNCDLNTTNNEGRMPVHLACIEGKIDVVQYLVEECRVEFNSRDKEERTPFLLASAIGHLTVVKYLIEKRCDPSQRDIHGNIPAHYAAQNGHLSVVKYLKEQLNCDLNTTNNEGRMPVHLACIEGKIDVVQYLVEECRVEFNSRDKQECTPFLLASAKGHLTIVKYLIGKRCDPLQRDIYGNTPAHYAAFGGHLSVVKYLKSFEHSSKLLYTFNDFGEWPLHTACRAGKMTIIQYLIEECGMSVDTKSKFGVTPLHYAAFNGHLDIAEYVVQKSRCESVCIDIRGDMPSHYATVNGNINMLLFLLNLMLRNNDPKHTFSVARNQLSCSPKIKEQEKLAIIKFLTSKVRNDLKSRNNEGNTPLHIAAQSGYHHIVEYIIQELEFKSIPHNKYGCTPLDIATVHHNHEVVEFLQQHTTNRHSPPSVIHLSALLGHISSVQHYITDLQYDPDLQDSIGRTPLHYAAMKGHLIIAQLLISSKADPLSEDVFHNLPLHYAAALGHLEVVKFLVNIGSPLTARGVWDKTPAEMAAAGGHRKCVSYLNSLSDKDELD